MLYVTYSFHATNMHTKNEHRIAKLEHIFYRVQVLSSSGSRHCYFADDPTESEAGYVKVVNEAQLLVLPTLLPTTELLGRVHERGITDCFAGAP